MGGKAKNKERDTDSTSTRKKGRLEANNMKYGAEERERGREEARGGGEDDLGTGIHLLQAPPARFGSDG